MTTSTVPTIDKSRWPVGPWTTEPDKMQFVTAVGLPGLIVRNRMGALCGYAAVAPGHPLYEQGYDVPDVDVHGGLTYADHCQGDICHVPAPGEPDNVWWFGWDAAHGGDLVPSMIAFNEQFNREHPQYADVERDVYRDLAYVRAEVESLAAQLATVGAGE